MDGPHDDANALLGTPSPRRAALRRLLATGAAALSIVGLGAGSAAARNDKRGRGRSNHAAAAAPRANLTAFRVVTNSATLHFNQGFDLTAFCDDGEVATGGGYDVETSTAGIFVHASAPNSAATSWTAQFINTGQQEPKVTTFVVCMKSAAPTGD